MTASLLADQPPDQGSVSRRSRDRRTGPDRLPTTDRPQRLHRPDHPPRRSEAGLIRRALSFSALKPPGPSALAPVRATHPDEVNAATVEFNNRWK
jgi:hypothetical protein